MSVFYSTVLWVGLCQWLLQGRTQKKGVCLESFRAWKPSETHRFYWSWVGGGCAPTAPPVYALWLLVGKN